MKVWRQPEQAGMMRVTMFIGVGLVEAIPIMAVVIAFIAILLIVEAVYKFLMAEIFLNTFAIPL